MEQSIDQNLKVIGWVTAAIGVITLADQIPSVQYLTTLEDQTNLTKTDLAATCTLATSLMAASYAFTQDRRAKIQHFALRFPAASLLAKVLTSKAIKQSTQQIPVLNWFLGCPNEQCTGTCNSCALRSMVLFTAIIRAIV